MTRTKKILLSLIILSIMGLNSAMARDYIIYSIVQNVPMGTPNEKVVKNFYINMGENHGIKPGSTLDVNRSLSRIDPYDGNKRHYYKVKVGELEVLHVEENAAITSLKNMDDAKKKLLFEYKSFMIGDNVKVKLK